MDKNDFKKDHISESNKDVRKYKRIEKKKKD